MTRRITLEIAVTTADEARRAVAAGADRLELGSVLDVGGVTPSPGTFLESRASVAVPVWVLLRPRPGGFMYSDAEFATLKRDAEWFLRHGADGIVFGFLTEAGRIDRDRSRQLVQLAEGRAVFHRAFDFLPDPIEAVDELVDLGFRRLLTSGGAVSGTEGAATIAQLVRLVGSRLEILAGGGIRPENVAELLHATGCDQVHASAREPAADSAAIPVLAAQMGTRATTSAELVARLRAAVDGARTR